MTAKRMIAPNSLQHNGLITPCVLASDSKGQGFESHQAHSTKNARKQLKKPFSGVYSFIARPLSSVQVLPFFTANTPKRDKNVITLTSILEGC
jgi:hypothetical protein